MEYTRKMALWAGPIRCKNVKFQQKQLFNLAADIAAVYEPKESGPIAKGGV
jgi:hypothetical protein